MNKGCGTLILAAGKGTRMKSNLPKVLHLKKLKAMKKSIESKNKVISQQYSMQSNINKELRILSSNFIVSDVSSSSLVPKSKDFTLSFMYNKSSAGISFKVFTGT